MLTIQEIISTESTNFANSFDADEGLSLSHFNRINYNAYHAAATKIWDKMSPLIEEVCKYCNHMESSGKAWDDLFYKLFKDALKRIYTPNNMSINHEQ